MRRKYFIISLITALIFTVFTFSCKPLDFSKAEEFKTLEKWDGSIFQIELNGDDFYQDTIPVYELRDTVPFELFDKSYIKKGFVKIKMETFAVNSLPAEFEWEICYLNEQTPLDTVVIHVDAGSVQNPREIHVTDEHDNSEYPPFISFDRIALRLRRADSTDLHNRQGKFSAGVNFNLYLQIE